MPDSARRLMRLSTIFAILLFFSAHGAEKVLAMSEHGKSESMIQSLIDHPDLDQYFHADVRPERKPLVISLEGMRGADMQLNKFGVPVEFAREGSASGPVLTLKFEKLGDGNTAIDFSYDVEGVTGRATFADQNGQPVLEDIWVAEGG